MLDPWDLWDFIDLDAAKEHCYIATELIELFDLANGRVRLLKPTSIDSEGVSTYEL